MRRAATLPLLSHGSRIIIVRNPICLRQRVSGFVHIHQPMVFGPGRLHRFIIVSDMFVDRCD
jgi:hypothetical protein